MKRDFLLELSTGYLYDYLEHATRQYDGAAFRAKVLSEFSRRNAKGVRPEYRVVDG